MAIVLHMKHMDGTAPTTGPAGERSQADMMRLMQTAYEALTGSRVPENSKGGGSKGGGSKGGMRGM